MLEDKEIKVEEPPKNLPQSTENNELDEAIDMSLIALPLNTEEKQLVAEIVNAPTKEDLQRQFELFNINQIKKNALRIIKLNKLLGEVDDQAIERFEKRPDQASNKDLLDYMTVVSGQIDRAQKSIDTLSEKPAIHVSNQKNEVNINVATQLDQDGKERVIDAIQSLLKQVKAPKKKEQIIEADVVDVPKETIESSESKDAILDEVNNASDKNDEKILYNKSESDELKPDLTSDMLNTEE